MHSLHDFTWRITALAYRLYLHLTITRGTPDERVIVGFVMMVAGVLMALPKSLWWIVGVLLLVPLLGPAFTVIYFLRTKVF